MKATITQLAAYVGVSERTIHRRLASGKWPYRRLPGGLVEIDDSLIIGPVDEQESAILTRLKRIEQKLDDLAAIVGAMSQIGNQPAPVRLHTERSAYTVESDLPGGLVSWRSFAILHQINESTVYKAIHTGRLAIVEGEWRMGKVLVKGALDAPGRAKFYELYHDNPHFHPCPECPHI